MKQKGKIATLIYRKPFGRVSSHYTACSYHIKHYPEEIRSSSGQYKVDPLVCLPLSEIACLIRSIAHRPTGGGDKKLLGTAEY